MLDILFISIIGLSILITSYTWNIWCNDQIFIDNDFDDNEFNNNDDEFIDCCSDDNNFNNIFTSSYNKEIKTPYVIGIAGGSGSGKTYIANLIENTIKQTFPNSKCKDSVIISQDSYYKGGDINTNYDIPESIDFDLLINHINDLSNGLEIECPIYDFTTHSRSNRTRKIKPTKIIIIEGILIFVNEKLRDLMNIKVFIDASGPTQVFRRLDRDMNERGRSLEEVKFRYINHVEPSYRNYIIPSSRNADITINNLDGFYVGPQILLSHIIEILKHIC